MGKKKKAEMMLYSGIMSAYPMISQIDRPKIEPGRNIPDDMILDVEDSGVFLGLDTGNGKGYYVGKRSTDDGNILVVGINGSGKSHFLAKSTLRTMDDPAVVLDIKGEMSSCYEILQHRGLARRSYIVFDPTNGGVHYDVYALLERDDPHLVQYVREIANAIIPMPLDVREPYWINMARDFLSGAIIYYFETRATGRYWHGC